MTGLMPRPAGRLRAEKLRLPTGVVALTAIDRGWPSTAVASPGFCSTGACSADSVTILATEGVPCAFMANNIHCPGKAIPGLLGTATW